MPTITISKDTHAALKATAKALDITVEEALARDVKTGFGRSKWNATYFASPKGKKAIKRAAKAKAGK